MIGLFGFACKVLLLSGLRLGPGLNWKKVATCAPLLITALVSQPIAGAPVMLVIGMAFVPRVVNRKGRVVHRLKKPGMSAALAAKQTSLELPLPASTMVNQ